MKKALLSLIVLVLVFCCAISVNAESITITTKMEGTSSTPYFKMTNQEIAFCIDASLAHPKEDMEYMASNLIPNDWDEIRVREIKSIFINAYNKSESDADMLNKVVQQCIWAKLNKEVNYRAMTGILLGENAVKLFDELIKDVDTSAYNVDFTVYNLKDSNLQGFYQRLISAKVSIIPVITPEPTPNITPEIVPNPEPVPAPEIEFIPEPEPELMPEPEPELMQNPEPEPIPERVLEYQELIPKTGDNSNIVTYAIISLTSAILIVLLLAKKRKIAD